MNCPKCGTAIDENVKFCTDCGAELCSETVTENIPTPQASENPKPINKQNEELGMKWYKFLIWFELIFSPIINFADGVLCISGFEYEGLGISSTSAINLPEYRFFDIIYGILLIAMAAFGLYTRFRLSKFKSDAPKIYIAYDIVATVLNGLYTVIGAILSANEGFGSAMSSLAGLVLGEALYVWLNIIYFKKRKHLFVN